MLPRALLARFGWAVARRVRLRAESEWAVAMEFRINNPCDRIGPVLGPQHNIVEHLQALPHRKVAADIRTAQASTALAAVRLAFKVLVLTAARWGVVRWTEWAAYLDAECGQVIPLNPCYRSDRRLPRQRSRVGDTRTSSLSFWTSKMPALQRNPDLDIWPTTPLCTRVDYSHRGHLFFGLAGFQSLER